MSYHQEGVPTPGDSQEIQRSEESGSNYEVEVYRPEEIPWDTIKEDILRIDSSASEGEPFPEEMLERDFQDPDTTVILMRDRQTDAIVGFSYAKPTTKTYPEDFPERPASQDTAYIYYTALDTSHQGQGLVVPLLEKLDEELSRRGYMFIERDAADDKGEETEESYADKLRKNYRERIVAEESHDSEYGPQVFFRMRTRKSEEQK